MKYAVVGIVAAATVLGVGHCVAAFIDPAASPFYAMGAWVVDHTPHAMKDAAIRRFGSNDKVALFVSMGLVMVLGAAVVGLVERYRRPIGVVLLVLLGGVVGFAAWERPTATPWFVLPTIVGVVAGVAALRLLIGETPHGETEGTVSRRRFLTLTAGAGAAALGAAVAGQWIGARRRDVTADRSRFVVPRPVDVAPATPPGVRVQGVTDFVTANDRFYRVDTALQLPTLTSGDWRLRIHGMVNRPVEFDFDDLRRRPAVSRLITMTCVSNEVGGELAGTALWTGYRLADLLAEAGVNPSADMLLSRSVDGFTAGTPVAAVTDGRDALLAVGMNGAPLPIEHGYPARMIVPGLYGYVSATKWVIDLELTRFDSAQAYWTERGWGAQAPIKSASRIDVPTSFATLTAGAVTVAGVAWCQQRGIDAVEVQVDDQPWRQATLAAEYSTDTWRQWSWQWDAEPGMHTLRVRATDRGGQTQTDSRTPPFPNGSTGWHSRVVNVR
ncbi:molybdopterin-dependent oxidoreductase [Nocardia sp. NPDC051463]|uniref:molybdopterin-dependent oxidoreductase n=1 Tax=Nocardia sp. NPDC051463 TaxID=3154845 RepID=UPI00344E2911